MKYPTFLKALWRMIPSGARKAKLHCLLYSSGRIRFSFSSHFSVNVRFKGKSVSYSTKTIPFAIKTYLRYFFRYYTPAAGHTIVDAGAFHGDVSLFLSKAVGKDGKVYAFEPDRNNTLVLKNNIQLNGLNNVFHYKEGLWDKVDKIAFYSNGTVASSIYYEAPDAVQEQITLTDLDSCLLSHIDRLDFIKMNIEGAEIKALKGASKLLSKFKPHVAVTTDHKVDNRYTSEEVELLLGNFGYRTETVHFGKARVTYGIPNVVR